MAAATSTVDMGELRRKMEECDYVRFTLADIHGIHRGKTVPSRNVAAFLEGGMPFYAGMCTFGAGGDMCLGFDRVNATNHGNVIAHPIPDTFHLLPWAGKGKYQIGEILCETHWDDGTAQEACTRALANQQLKKLEELGFCLLSGTEWEYYIIEKKKPQPMTGDLDFCCNFTLERYGDLMYDIEKQLSGAGVNTSYLMTEYAPGQFEFPLEPASGIKAADMSFILKEGVREICDEKGYQGLFVTKPFPEYNGSGAHFNHSIWDIKTGANGFYDGYAADKLSQNAHYWIGGLMKHAAALSALCCPTVNCYRRYFQPWAPTDVFWGFEDRMSSFRVKNSSPTGTYIENRIPGGLCNPYLVMAATVAAGIDGIVNKIPSPPNGKTDKSERMPKNLTQALISLETDKDFVEALCPGFVDAFLQLKRELELPHFKNSDPSVHDEEALAEERKYYGRLV